MRRNGGGVSGLRSPHNGVYDNEYFPSNEDEDEKPRYVRVLGPLAPIFLSRDRTDPEALQNRLRIYSLCLIVTSAFFWFWALLNTLDLRKSGGIDLGVISFFGSGVSSALLLKSSLGGKWHDKNQKFGCCGKRGDVDDYDLYLGSSRNADENNNNVSKQHSPPGRVLRVFAVVTQFVVVCNYLLGLMFALTAGKQMYVYFGTYCSIFSVLWMTTCYAGFVLVKVYIEAVRNAYGEEALNDGKSSGRGGGSCLRRLLLILVNRSAVPSPSTLYYEEEEEDEIDQELMSLVEDKGNRYSNTS
mmetsp:Transcript_9306/g.14270  ORF Transcript_9306/g.14270 Transcript_9306/m.14270 type:complete len:300 (-) Transcript_9306:780-1679(-)|eukprot:CAMPEP_0201730360 /NCGR_PEP_ID=MMETSP0593-20130828/21904_1 /ASSEMBLY_ACC=CAM_ASM_000672 /TAXON_ID=267983 /ORGANISM="Skeletonema japonicum, Strain CCMP2506" /LENGTH=299 /DNA_ID=CAMNT_0048222879 /DNA_START=152 /DNA_END=1051 /DNA_ORIENTATION=+